MKNCLRYILLFLLPMAFILLAPQAQAGLVAGTKFLPLPEVNAMPDSAGQKKPVVQDEKADKKKKADQKPDIKEVPKSKRQLKPAAVKTKVKIKTPVKKIKPVIKKPVKLVRKTLGL